MPNRPKNTAPNNAFRAIAVVLIALAFFLAYTAANAGPHEGERADWQAVTSSGGTASNDFGSAMQSMGAGVAGVASNGQYTLYHGFAASFQLALKPDCIAGDADLSGSIDIDDVLQVVGFMFAGFVIPTSSRCCADANGSGEVDIDDAVYPLYYIFNAGPLPVGGC